MNSKKFKYDLVKEKLVSTILERRLPDGAQLPSEYELSHFLGVARNTVRNALEQLSEEGIIKKRRGHPCKINLSKLVPENIPEPRKIAWLDTGYSTNINPVYFEIFRSVTEAAVRRNIRLNYISLLSNGTIETFLNSESNYSGSILNTQLSIPSVLLDRIDKKRFLLLDPPDLKLPFRTVATDNYAGARIAMNYLYKNGHRNIIFGGISNTLHTYAPFAERLRGYRDFSKEHSLSELLLLSDKPEDFLNVENILKKNLDMIKKSDAIFVISDLLAIQIITALARLGIHIPEDISLIGFDGIIQSQFITPPLTTVKQPMEKIAEEILDTILGFHDDEFSVSLVPRLITPELRIGGTVKTKS